MAKLNLTLLHIFLSFLSILALVKPSLAQHNLQTMSFIQTSCQTTRYPALCMHCLGKYDKSKSTIQSPEELAHIALTVSLSRALDTRAYLLKVATELTALKNSNGTDYLTVQDCLRQINDSVDQLSQATKELRRLSRASQTGLGINNEVLWHISNVETWLSTALTDASSCVDSFPGQRMSKMRAMIKVKALNVVQVTSNALALFHRYAARFQEAAAAAAAGAIKKP